MAKEAKICGQLSKFTNALRGYQHRFFLLNQATGTLEYYLPDDHKRHHPRGFIILAGSIVTPSEDDSKTFTLISSTGEIYKLRATDSRQRQFWVDKIRQASQACLSPLEFSAGKSLEAVRDIVVTAKNDMQLLENAIDNHPVGDHDLFLIKALGQASVNAMKQCYSSLNQMIKT